MQWRPTDPDPEALASIAAWRDHAALPNLLPPLRLDASDPDSWPVDRADAVVNINMIHISPWAASEGLMEGAGRVLSEGGVLFLYGPGPSFNATECTKLSMIKLDKDELTAALRGITLEDFLDALESGEAYINVHTTANPGGEIRGQVE